MEHNLAKKNSTSEKEEADKSAMMKELRGMALK